MRAAAAIAVALLVAASAPARAEKKPGAPPNLREGTVAERIARAAALRSKDVRALGAELTALGAAAPPAAGPKAASPSPGTAPSAAATAESTLDFLVEFTAREPTWALRSLAAESARKLGSTAAASKLLDRLRKEKDPLVSARLAEALGRVGGPARAADLAEVAASAPVVAAWAAADEFSRVGTPDASQAFAEAAFARGWSPIVRLAARAVLDATGDSKSAARIVAAAAGSRAPAAAAAIAGAAPHEQRVGLASLRKALLAAPGTPKVAALNPAMEGWIRAALDHLRAKAPAEHWTVCAAFGAIATEDAPTRADAKQGRIVLSYDDAGLPPAKLACLLFRHASASLRVRTGDAPPDDRDRAWIPAILESWDLCAAASIHDAGRKGFAPETFVERALTALEAAPAAAK